ncbi:MAG TPA: ABC transporter ATP-binding protein [Beijerinckiaceae bacterium]|nr:ABC transporter ATP-binding protein [Beijerinckiaceae bacterium]
MTDASASAPPDPPAKLLHDRQRLIPAVRRLWQGWVRPHGGTILIIWLTVLVIAAMSSMYPYIIKRAFDAFDAKDEAFLKLTPVLVIMVTAMRGFAMFAQLILTNRVVSKVEADLQTSLFHSLIDADVAQLSRETPASLTQRFTTDFAYVREALTRLSTVLARDVATAVAVLAVMVWIDWMITLAALMVLPIIVPPIERIGKKLRRTALSTQEQTGIMASLVAESLGGVRIAKTYGLEPYLKSKAADAFDAVRRLKVKAANQRARLDPLLEVGGGVTVAAVLVFIGWRIAQGQSTIGDFTGYVTAVLLAAQSLRTLGNLNAILHEAVAALTRIFAVIDERPQVEDAVDGPELVVKQGEVAFAGVSFSYANSGSALSDVSLVVPAGKTTAFVGRSGAGKSSLLALVPRLFDPTAGVVTIDGTDIRSVSLKSLRAHLAVVSQDIVLFDDTIRANIAFGRQRASETEIIAAASAAAAHGFIAALPDGYDTRVGDRGGRLSGGERQRVALARAFLRNAPILLLDEPTSALDAQSEDLVQKALGDLMRGRTTLVVAHRLATVRAADLIVVMDEGRIVETGTHDSLMASDGAYAAFYRLQFGEGVTPA